MMKRNRSVSHTLVSVLLVVSAVAWSCGDGDDNLAGADDSDGDIVSGDESPAVNELPTTPVIYDDESLATADTVVTGSGLIYIQLEAGDGDLPGRGSLVSVHYTGFLEDGTVFDSSYPRRAAFRFALGQGTVIEGWEEGIALMSKGARGRLIIPPDLGYGSRGAGDAIPPNTTILFDVWLADVE